MLKLKTNKSVEKRLGKATPHRNMISNAKKQAIREKYLEKQYKRMRGGEEAKTAGKGRRTDEHDDSHNNDDNGLEDLL
jgi:ribosomal protein L35